MSTNNIRTAVYCLLAVACVIQTSLLVTYTVMHVQRQRQLQLNYQDLMGRAQRLLLSCSRGHGGDAGDVIIKRSSRQSHGQPYMQQLSGQLEGILIEHCRNDSKLCLPGLKGDTGPTGLNGTAGARGLTGGQGPNGTRGAIGDPGLNGTAGHQGSVGSKGETGDAGPIGPQGSLGLIGVKGDAGVKGTAGSNGTKGRRGPKGDEGAPGPAGVPGSAGQAGSTGDPGPAGPRGANGAMGPKGQRGQISNCSCFASPKAKQNITVIHQGAFQGSALTLDCPITGSPEPHVDWSREGGSLPRGATIKGTQLTIPHVTANDIAKYTCTATNVLGSASVIFDVKLSDLNCDFENGFCAWNQSYHDDQNWHLQNGMTSTILTGPDADHTRKTVDGHYAYLESSQGNQGDMAELESPPLELTSPLCLVFWYNMYGADVDTLAVFAQSSTGPDTQLWSKSGDQGRGWRATKVSVTPPADGSETQIIFRAIRGRSIEGDIAIDDIQVTPGMCIESPDSVNCDFQIDTCGWTDSGQWSWTRHKGPSGFPNTGPMANHNGSTTEYYAYAAGNSASQGSKARLSSHLVDSTTPVCVKFYYHMFGPGEGSLSLNVKEGNSEYPIWQRSGDQDQKWHQAEVTIPQNPVHVPYNLVFEATKGSNAGSDVAVDDVTVTANSCEGDIVGLGCDFELLTLCTWSQGTKDNLDWDLQVASTGVKTGGPATDHTLQTERGHYVSVSSSGQVRGQEAALDSRTLPRTTIYCLSLWYYIPSADSGTISIFREVFGSRTESLREINYKAPPPGHRPEWTHLSFSIPSYWTDYSLTLIATTGDDSAPPLAVDDILLKAGVCQ